jgi:hypothetical protein
VKAESVRANAIRRLSLRPGDYPSFYRTRRRQFTSVPHCFIYVWRYGVQCRGVDDRPGESRFWWDVMACPVSVQERLRGWRCRGCPFSGRPRADSRVPLTRGCIGHNSGCGDFLSPRVSTASGMALQWLGWPHRADGDGGDAADVTAWPRASAEQASIHLRGFHRPLSRVRHSGRTGVGGTVPRS